MITFRSGFNNGSADNIQLSGTASNYVVSYSGSNVTFFSAIDRITVTIPVGEVANNITFDNGDTRPLSLVGGLPQLGDQAIPNSNTSAAVPVTAGPGTYTVSGASTATEGDTVTFTVTRTDTSVAENLSVSVVGSTVGGTVVAATGGADFNTTLNPSTTLSFGVGEVSKTFVVQLNVDQLTEGAEGYSVNVLKGLTQVATVDSLILDANVVGQTFVLSNGIDLVGTGQAGDLIGSQGSTSTAGQDTIIGTQTNFNTFDNINGGAELDTLVVLDNGFPFTFPPNFANVTVMNVENMEYSSPNRGFFNGALNTSAAGNWTGLEMITAQINSNLSQTVTMKTDTALDITQAGNGQLNIFGGGGVLNAWAASGDVNVGTNGGVNSWTEINVTGGDDITIQDNNPDTLDTVNLSMFQGDATISNATVLTEVNVSDISQANGGNFYRDLNITGAGNPTVNLMNIFNDGNGVGDFDITSSFSLVVNAAGSNVNGLNDITASNGNLVVNSTSGTLNIDDLRANGTNRSITLNANGGGFNVDELRGNENGGIDTVNLNGNSFIDIQTVDESGSSDGTDINANSTGGVIVRDQLGNNTGVNGVNSSGSDTFTFGATIRANTFGGGNDFITFNAAGFGNNNGSFDAGAGNYDTLRMESNNAAAFTAGGPTNTSNFERLWLMNQSLGLADCIDLGNIGFEGDTDVYSQVGNVADVTEVVTFRFAGQASGEDGVIFDGVTVTFANDAFRASQAASFIAQYNGAGTGDWVASAGAQTGEVVLTNKTSGEVADLTTADFTFFDDTSFGAPTLEAFSPVYFGFTNDSTGVVGVPAETEVYTLELTSVTVASGETVIFTIGATDYTYTNGTGDAITQEGDALQDELIAWNGIPGYTITKNVDGDVIITADAPGASPDISTTITGNGLTVSDDFTFTKTNEGSDEILEEYEEFHIRFDGTTTANDQVVFDGVTVTFSGSDLTPDQMAAEFLAATGGSTTNWDVAVAPSILADRVVFTAKTAGPRPDVTAADFTFIDDTNVGTPSIDPLNVTTQGSSSSVTLKNFVSGSDLILANTNGEHIVELDANTNNDVLNLLLSANGNHGPVTANEVETVNINTDSAFNGNDTLVLNDTSLTTLNISGRDGLNLTTDSTQVAVVDASGMLNGPLNWAIGPNTVPISITTGNGGSNIDMSGMLIQGLAPITFNGGAGADNVLLGGIGTSRANLTLGGGKDTVTVDVVDGGNDYSSILDFNDSIGASGDELRFVGGGTFVAVRDQQLEPTATFQDYLDQATDGDGGTIRWFYFGGDTYVVQDNTIGEDFQDGSDTLIRIEGEVNLQPEHFS